MNTHLLSRAQKNPPSSHLLPTLFTIPKSSWLLRHTHTIPVKPFVWTLVVIARHHVARTHTAASAVLAVISLALGILHIGIGPFLLAISIAKSAVFPRIFGWGRFQVSGGCNDGPGSTDAGNFLTSWVASAGKLLIAVITSARC